MGGRMLRGSKGRDAWRAGRQVASERASGGRQADGDETGKPTGIDRDLHILRYDIIIKTTTTTTDGSRRGPCRGACTYDGCMQQCPRPTTFFISHRHQISDTCGGPRLASLYVAPNSQQAITLFCRRSFSYFVISYLYTLPEISSARCWLHIYLRYVNVYGI
jgi:hypothetical protein